MKSREIKIIIVLSLIISMLVSVNAWLILLAQRKAAQSAEILVTEKKSVIAGKESRQLQNILNDTESKRHMLDAYFIQKQEPLKFIEEIERIGKDAGLSISVTSVIVPDKIEELHIDMKTEGKFEDIFYFLSLLENLPYKIRIDRANLSIDSTGGEGFMVTPVRGSGKETKEKANWIGTFSIILESFLKI